MPSIRNSHRSERVECLSEAAMSSSESGSSTLPDSGDTGLLANRLEKNKDMVKEGIPSRVHEGEMEV